MDKNKISKKTFSIALTGGIGSGKSVVGGIFSELGITVIDSDYIVHELLLPSSEYFEQIAKHFGPSVVNSDNTLNRTKIGDIVFSSIEEKKWLEHLLHPQAYKRMWEIAEQSTSPYCVMLIPLLFETARNVDFDRVLVIDAPEALQIARVQERANYDENKIRLIMSHQHSRDQRLAKADDVIINDGALKELRENVLALHKKYLKLAAEGNA